MPWGLDPGTFDRAANDNYCTSARGTGAGQINRDKPDTFIGTKSRIPTHRSQASLTAPVQHTSLHRIKYSSPNRHCSFVTVSRSTSTKDSGRRRQTGDLGSMHQREIRSVIGTRL